MSQTKQRPPVWMIVLIIIFLLPAFSFPILAANIIPCPARQYVSWILLVLMGLSTAAVWTLVLHPGAAAV